MRRGHNRRYVAAVHVMRSQNSFSIILGCDSEVRNEKKIADNLDKLTLIHDLYSFSGVTAYLDYRLGFYVFFEPTRRRKLRDFLCFLPSAN